MTRPITLDDWRRAEADAEQIVIIGATTGSLLLSRIELLPQHVTAEIQKHLVRDVLWKPKVCDCCGNESDDEYEEVPFDVRRIVETVVVECLRNEWPILADVRACFDAGQWQTLCHEAGLDPFNILDRRTA